MSDRDPFTEGQDAAEDLRRGLEGLREDVGAIVREEVAKAGVPAAELERMVGELVEARLSETRAGSSRSPAPAVWVAGIVVGLLAGAFGYHLLTGGSGEDGAPVAGADSVPAAPALAEESGPAGGPSGGVSGRASPETRAAMFDSLFAAGSSMLEPLMVELEGRAAAPVTEALARWRAGDALDAGARRRLHDALVQAAVNRLAGSSLVLDGLVTRNPCGGASCGAVLRLWETRGEELGLPPLPDRAQAREVALPTVERLLVLRGVEVAGG